MARYSLKELLSKNLLDSTKKWLRFITGWFLILLGIAGLFLPFLQGILLIALGAGLLSKGNPRVKNFFHHLKDRLSDLKIKMKDAIQKKLSE